MSKSSEPVIYLISGLGADQRVYKRLTFPFETKYILWEDHSGVKSLNDYAKKLIPQINQERPIILIGLSFGGLIAQELDSILDSKQLIIISSLNGHRDMPSLYRFLGFLRLQYLLPAKFLQNNPFTNIIFGIKNKSSKDLLKRILEDTSLSFLKWATIQCLKWRREKSEKIIQIHGTSDRIIPSKNVNTTYLIKDGSHFMIVDKHKELQVILDSIIT